MRAFQITTHCVDTTARREYIKEKVNLFGWFGVVGVVIVQVALVEEIDK